jgi:hypothetical protein
MSYDFEGFFASVAGDTSALLADAKQQWSQARVRTIGEPFCGVGVGLILSQYEPLASDAAALKDAYQRFVAWTATYPKITFVWINACCIPVGCAYRGSVVRNGRERRAEKGDRALARLVKHLGVRLDSDEYFEPFTRGYFTGSTASSLAGASGGSSQLA